MPITADLGGKNYTLGRGRVFFDRYPNNVAITASTQGEGERYIGNTPEFSTTSSSEDLDHYSSEGGVRVKDDSVQLSMDRTGSFVTDNISLENLALYFLGDADKLTAASATGVISTISKAKKGRFYQLGATPTLPQGVRMVSNVVVKKGVGFATTVTMAGNYEVDETLGRLYIETTSADIPDDTDLQVTFDVAASTSDRVISKTQSIYGAIRFVSDNPKGVNRDYYLPYVKLSPDGDYNLKGDEWQQIGFSMEILQKGTLPSIIITSRPATT